MEFFEEKDIQLDSEKTSIEKPKKEKRPVSEKQAEALRKNREKASEKIKSNKILLNTIKNNLDSNFQSKKLEDDIKYIKDFVDEEKKRKEMKKKAQPIVEKEEYYNLINNVNHDIFFR